MKKIARIMGIKQVEKMVYLGIKFAPRRLKKNDFNFLLDKAMKTLNALGNRYILVGVDKIGLLLFASFFDYSFYNSLKHLKGI